MSSILLPGLGCKQRWGFRVDINGAYAGSEAGIKGQDLEATN